MPGLTVEATSAVSTWTLSFGLVASLLVVAFEAMSSILVWCNTADAVCVCVCFP